MSIFRVEHTTGFTVMSNYHLRDKNLSLKAKGLLSQMLSLPEEWDYTLAGLSFINREKIDAVREAIKELENAGYIVRTRERDEKGRLKGTEYVIYEQPQKCDGENPAPDNPEQDNPASENPTLDNPTLEKPTLENPTQLNTYKRSGQEPKKNAFFRLCFMFTINSSNEGVRREILKFYQFKSREKLPKNALFLKNKKK